MGRAVKSTVISLIILLCFIMLCSGSFAADTKRGEVVNPSQPVFNKVVTPSNTTTITTEKLTVTIKPSSTSLSPSDPVNVTTEKLTVTIKTASAPLSPSQPIDVTTEKLTVTIKTPLQPMSP